METINRINGNKQEYVTPLPTIYMLGHMNDVALKHVTENTGLVFKETMGGYEATPTSSNQIVTLFLTYNFKTRYFNNGSHKNMLMIKSDHHTGFDVESICYDCVKHNHIHTGGLKDGDRLAC